MKRIILTFGILVIILSLNASVVNAQYSKSWSSIHWAYFVGCENMDNDAAKEVVFMHSATNYSWIHIYDGVTGNLEWSAGNWYWIEGEVDHNYLPRLIDVDGDGRYEVLFAGHELQSDNYTWHLYKYTGGSSVASSPQENKPTNPELYQNYPNPFNPDTNIEYTIPKDSQMTLKIYNLNGELVTTLVEGKVKSGSYTVKWNGKDDNGKTVSSGVYFYQIQAEGYNSTKKMITIK